MQFVTNDVLNSLVIVL